LARTSILFRGWKEPEPRAAMRRRNWFESSGSGGRFEIRYGSDGSKRARNSIRLRKASPIQERTR
jgi:hypothetical protein